MKKKIVAIISGAVMTTSGFTGCASTESDTSSAKTSTATASEKSGNVPDYHVIEPPAEGWSAEELMSVTYLYGKRLEYPLTLDSLGDSIELKNMEPNIAGNIHVGLYHDDKLVGNVIFKVKTVEEVSDDTPIDSFLFMGDDIVPDSLVINGKSIDADYVDMKKYLGEVVENSESSEKAIFYKTKDDSFTIDALNSEGVFSMISINNLCDAK